MAATPPPHSWSFTQEGAIRRHHGRGLWNSRWSRVDAALVRLPFPSRQGAGADIARDRSIFNAFDYSTAHWILTAVFVVCVAISAACQTLETMWLERDQ